MPGRNEFDIALIQIETITEACFLITRWRYKYQPIRERVLIWKHF